MSIKNSEEKPALEIWVDWMQMKLSGLWLYFISSLKYRMFTSDI